MIWQPEFTDKTLSRKPGAVQIMFREYDRLIITKGYPKRDDSSRRIDVPYDGYEVKTITHPHFGDKPVKVFAIKVNISTEYQSAQHKVKNVQSD
ncbi:hypothetical protein BH694_10960 [Escherichia coli]|uniref:hypothetical protein n=1 Tax=Escherichia coli TaxID=562 RepID=UPI000BD40AFC|nr:hypothetical protein [Escherichia coli]PCM23683.1 hypothetical protein BH694_10960 [Escherichia coli]